MNKVEKFSKVYKDLISLCLKQKPTMNERTKQNVFIVPHPVSFLLDIGKHQLPIPVIRKVYPKSAAAEIAWFFKGTQDATWLKSKVSFWDQFLEDDKKTLTNSYGYRWSSHFGRDQIVEAIKTLKKDPTSRQVNISAWDPAIDGLGESGVSSKNIPCPTNFTLNLIDGKLNCAVFLRSSDVAIGLPYDVMGYGLLLDAFANELGVATGYLHFTLAHAHLYQIHFEQVAFAISSENLSTLKSPKLKLPKWSITSIKKDPDGYVKEVGNIALLYPWVVYNPKFEIVK